LKLLSAYRRRPHYRLYRRRPHANSTENALATLSSHRNVVVHHHHHHYYYYFAIIVGKVTSSSTVSTIFDNFIIINYGAYFDHHILFVPSLLSQ
jgi:hypothetical protein